MKARRRNPAGFVVFRGDGNGATAAVQFAELAPGLALTENDFLIV
jgi:hypothetical protein